MRIRLPHIQFISLSAAVGAAMGSPRRSQWRRGRAVLLTAVLFCAAAMSVAGAAQAQTSGSTATINVLLLHNMQGFGTVTSQPSGIDCHPTCSASVPAGTIVTLEAKPGPDVVFVEWGGACSGIAPTCTVVASGTMEVTAFFNMPTQTFNDNAGSRGGWFSYYGTWNQGFGQSKYEQDDHYSSTAGSNYTFTTNGTQFAFYGAKAPHHGHATFQVDGGPAVTVDQYSSTRQDNVLIYRTPVLVSDRHTVKATVKGARNPSSSGNVIAIDRVVVEQPPNWFINDAVVGTTRNTFAYAGTWRVGTGVWKYRDDDHYSSTTGSSYSLPFVGTRVALFGAKAPHHGHASVQIDGGAPVTIDHYAATRQDMAFLYRSPVLAKGSHVVKVTVKGTRNAASSGNTIAIDRADVTG